MSEKSEKSESSRDEKIDLALNLYIQGKILKNAENRHWLAQPTNFISVVAIAISLAGAAYQFWKDHNDGIDKDLASLSAIVSELTKLDSEMFTANVSNPRAVENLSIITTNRRVALLTEAGRLVNGLGGKAPRAQLALLGPEYFMINDYDTALRYYNLMTVPSASSMERLSGWRSIAILYSSEGPSAIENARGAFKKAAEVLPDPKDVGSIGLAIGVLEQWGQFEFSSRNYSHAFQHFNEARKLANRFPCVPDRNSNIARINMEGNEAIGNVRKTDPAEADREDGEWGSVVNEDMCPTEVSKSSIQKVVGEESRDGLTTKCRFTNGPRSGTTVDFSPYGITGVPVGSYCTDGLSSTGVAAL